MTLVIMWLTSLSDLRSKIKVSEGIKWVNKDSRHYYCKINKYKTKVVNKDYIHPRVKSFKYSS